MRAPEPHFDKQTKIFAVYLPGLEKDKNGELSLAPSRSPFDEETELDVQKKRREVRERMAKLEDGGSGGKGGDGDKGEDDGTVCTVVQAEGLQGLQERAIELPLAAGRYSSLVATKDKLYFIQWSAPEVKNEIKPGYTERSFNESSGRAMAMRISRKRVGSNNSEPYEFAPGMKCTRIELTAGGTKLMLQDQDGKGYVAKLSSGKWADESRRARVRVPHSSWTLAVRPALEWQQMFVEAWRLQRDHFYDRNMHGVDWHGMLQKYLPLVSRLRCRNDLSDLLAQLVGELR
jgi:tricorn protease